jgi:hypothetical protein
MSTTPGVGEFAVGGGSQRGLTSVTQIAGAPGDTGIVEGAATSEVGRLATTRVNMPPVQDSASLVLIALGALGAGQLARLARGNLSARTTPDWYHSGGAIQVRHIHPAGPDLTALPECMFPHIEPPTLDPRLDHHQVFQPSGELFAGIQRARGPPWGFRAPKV